MASFVLIHGNWHGGWCFDPVADILRSAGHEVIAPDLPGMGARGNALDDISLDLWAEFTVALCRDAAQKPPVLVGHSRGGIVISRAAELAPEAVDRLVYVCALMLPDGKSVAEWRAEEFDKRAIDEIIDRIEDGKATVVDPDRAAQHFAQLAPTDVAQDAMTRLVSEPTAPATTKLSLSPERFGSKPRCYIRCTQDRVIPLVAQDRMIAALPDTRVATLDSDHSPFLSFPSELGELLTRQ